MTGEFFGSPHLGATWVWHSHRGARASLPRKWLMIPAVHIAKTHPEAHGTEAPGHKPRHLAGSVSHERRSADTRPFPGSGHPGAHTRARRCTLPRPPHRSCCPRLPPLEPIRVQEGSESLRGDGARIGKLHCRRPLRIAGARGASRIVDRDNWTPDLRSPARRIDHNDSRLRVSCSPHRSCMGPQPADAARIGQPNRKRISTHTVQERTGSYWAHRPRPPRPRDKYKRLGPHRLGNLNPSGRSPRRGAHHRPIPPPE